MPFCQPPGGEPAALSPADIPQCSATRQSIHPAGERHSCLPSGSKAASRAAPSTRGPQHTRPLAHVAPSTCPLRFQPLESALTGCSDFPCTLVTWKGNPNAFTQTVSHWVGLVESKNLFLSRLIKQIFKYLYIMQKHFFKKNLARKKKVFELQL